jgi:4-amino-4-deoxy-L-arabinose transferase-like glycosyltransferase
VAGCAAAVAAYIAFGRVFSPQYLVWLVPLVPLVAGRRGLRASALLLAVLGLTQVFEPYRYIEYWSSFTPWVTWSVVIRNALVLGLLGVLVWPEPRAHEARDEVAGGYTTAPLRP